jgi:hypothetical protein
MPRRTWDSPVGRLWPLPVLSVAPPGLAEVKFLAVVDVTSDGLDSAVELELPPFCEWGVGWREDRGIVIPSGHKLRSKAEEPCSGRITHC